MHDPLWTYCLLTFLVGVATTLNVTRYLHQRKEHKAFKQRMDAMFADLHRTEGSNEETSV